MSKSNDNPRKKKMTTQYDTIGDNYTSVKTTPGAIAEEHTLQAHLGDITDLTVLDLACGSGCYIQKALKWALVFSLDSIKPPT